MGRGDKKSKKGKLWRGSFGVSRKKKSGKAAVPAATTEKPVEVKAEVKAPKKRKTARKKAEG